MEMSALPILIPVSFLFFAILSALAGMLRPALGYAVALLGAALGAGLAVTGLVAVLDGEPLRHDLGGWAPPIGIEYVLDPLSGFIGAVVAIVGLAVLAFPPRAGFYRPLRPSGPWFCSLTLLLLAGLLGVVASGDLFHLFVFLEVYSVASYALVSIGGDRATVASFRYLIIASLGSSLYLLGVGFLYFSTGSLNMGDVAVLLAPIAGEPQVVAGTVLIVTGLAVKMALFPFHVWLPDAHSEAPPAVAALLAAVQVKVAAYALIRIMLDVFSPEMLAGDLPIGTMLAWFGAAGIVFGSVMAFRQLDLKRMLAYSTVAQLGFIGVGIGLATPLALTGALLHVLNHAFMKSCLFLAAGAIIHQTGLKNVARFAGLGRRMPVTGAAFTLAALAMVGVPPTAGFFSKWYLALASFDAGEWAFAAVIVGSSIITAVYFFRVLERLYLAEPEEEAVAEASEAGLQALAPMGTLAAGVLVLGIANVAIVTGVLDRIVAGL